MSPQAPFAEITASAEIATLRHGWRAKCLQRLIRLDLPVPCAVAIAYPAVQALAVGRGIDAAGVLAPFGPAPLLSVRPSPADPDWGGPETIFDIGMNAARRDALASSVGAEAADRAYAGFVQRYAVKVARMDPDMFDGCVSLEDALACFEVENEAAFPQDPAMQLAEVLRSVARAWEGTSARLLRQSQGAPAEAGFGIVVQAMLAPSGSLSGTGRMRFVDPVTGTGSVTGTFGETGLEALPQSVRDKLLHCGEICRRGLREEMEIEFAVAGSEVAITDAERASRSARAAVRIAVALAEDGVIGRDDAVLRVEPRALTELLHRQVDPRGPRDRLVRGIAASPGAAAGRIVFSATAAQASAARGEACILVRRETSPEDIRGMHAASGVLTERGGTTSHAAVIARGLGLPCVVGASELRFSARDRTLTAPDGRVLSEGDTITLDGTRGEALAGTVAMLEPALDARFRTLLAWADAVRDIGVRANADTPEDARIARDFEAEGIGLCRTEHMFFDADRLTVMREMIFAGTGAERAAALERLLPMQRADFTRLFEIMHGRPVCIRLLDPPLHEFLPQSREGLRDLAEALGKPVSEVTRRAEALGEFNPMLGMRGVRLGITLPEIYEMQARAILEAAVEADASGFPVVPEIMIPLVSAMREVELVKSRIEAVAANIRAPGGGAPHYRLGVMVETPRAALRAGDIAQHASFLSFGTNDLTQMTYGLSRDDAGRFMASYVQQGVFPEDPFTMLDLEAVGELLLIGTERGRKMRPELTVSLCGEHGGNTESIDFCRRAGFDYVSCSPFRVPVARLAAAHLALRERPQAAKP